MIIYCTHDLIFATKIASTAEILGIPARPARDLNKLRQRINSLDDGTGKPNHPVKLVFIDMALTDDALAMIHMIHPMTTVPMTNATNATQKMAADSPKNPTNPQTDRPTIVAFGSHVDAELLHAARTAGADHVMPRSQFTTALPGLLRQYSNEQ